MTNAAECRIRSVIEMVFTMRFDCQLEETGADVPGICCRTEGLWHVSGGFAPLATVSVIVGLREYKQARAGVSLALAHVRVQVRWQ